MDNDYLKPPERHAVLLPAPRSAKTSVVYCKSELESEDDGDEARKKSSFKKNHNASTVFAAAIATANDPCHDHGFQRTNHLVKIPSSRMSKRNHNDDGDLIADLGHHREVHCTVRFSNRDSNDKRDPLMLKDYPKVFDATANDDDLKPPRGTRSCPPPHAFA